LQEALSKLAPGVSVCIREGSYAGEFVIDAKGTDAAPIKIAGYPGEEVVLQEDSASVPDYVLQLYGSFISVKNLTVQGGGMSSGGSVLVYQANDITLSRIRTRYARGTGFNVLGAENVLVEDCLAHDHFDPNDTERGRGFALAGTNVRARRNVAYGNFHRGFDVYGDTLAENCVAFGNGSVFDVATGKTVSGGGGIGFFTGDGGQIHRSLSFHNASSGFRSSEARDGAWDHCTALVSHFSYTKAANVGDPNFKIRNNLALGGDNFLPDPADLAQVNNSWQLGIGDDVVLSKDPPPVSELWLAAGSPWDAFAKSDFLKPVPGSAIIDAAAELSDRPFAFKGKAPDLGAFEAE
jgi:hypothetical protein